jgi:hypothetical protein
VDGARWRNRSTLPVVVVTALFMTGIAPGALSAGIHPLSQSAAECNAKSPFAAARAAIGPLNTRGSAARAQSQLGKRGELTGRLLNVPIAAGAGLSVALPAESWVGPAVGNLVIYTRHTPATGSEVRAVNLIDGCDVRLAAPSEIERSAVLDPSAAALYVHSVMVQTRADAGVVRHDLASGTASQVVAPLRPTDDFGPIFGTDLRWSAGGDALAVQSCGFIACLTRVLDIQSGGVSTYATGGQGQLIGLTRRHLVTYASCPGLPCAVLSADLSSGAVTVLADDAFGATVASTTTGNARASIQTAAGIVEIDQ